MPTKLCTCLTSENLNPLISDFIAYDLNKINSIWFLNILNIIANGKKKESFSLSQKHLRYPRSISLPLNLETLVKFHHKLE